MNKGIKQAKGDYVLFINSGDTIRADADMEVLIGQLVGEDIISYNLEMIDSVAGKSWIMESPVYPDFKYFIEDSLPHAGSFIKRELLVSYGYYDENLKIASDWVFFMDAICINKCSYRHVNSLFSTFYMGGISTSASSRELALSERKNHIASTYPLYNSMVEVYEDWVSKRRELYKLKISISVRCLKKLGFLRWLKL
jgi:glycosyltransferase involved in cell wall biosynthesis